MSHLTFQISCKGNSYDIDYEKYRNHHFLTGLDEKLDRVAHRVYYDFCVNGFMANDNVYNYGTNIHERPEFLMTLGEVKLRAIESTSLRLLTKFIDSILDLMNIETLLMKTGMSLMMR